MVRGLDPRAPSISVPTGTTDDGRPGGVWLYAGRPAEPTLLGFAFDLEQAIGRRPLPSFGGSVPAPPPDDGICGTPIATHGSGSGVKTCRPTFEEE